MELLKRVLTTELTLCRTKRDVNRVFDAAESDVRERHLRVSEYRHVLDEIERSLPRLIQKEKQRVLVEEARTRIRKLLQGVQ